MRDTIKRINYIIKVIINLTESTAPYATLESELINTINDVYLCTADITIKTRKY